MNRSAEILPPLHVPSEEDSARELKHGAFYNTLAVLTSNFRSIFTFLIARLLGPAVLGTYMVAWATTDVISRLGILAFDVAVTTFIARAEAVGDHARSRSLFHIAVSVVVAQCAIVAALAIFVVRLFGHHFSLDPQMTAALSVMLLALPGVALYRMCTAVSRGMKVMRHDVFSRGITDSFVTTIAFIVALWFGFRTFAPEIALIVGSAASGIVAFLLAASLFRHVPKSFTPIPFALETRRLFAFATPISAYDFINSAITRVDVIMLACFIDKAPGVTLPIVGIYGTVVEVASGLRKVNQSFNPILGPIVAGLTVHGEQQRAAAAFTRTSRWMLWILLALLAVMIFAGDLILYIYGPQFRIGSFWLVIVALACGTNAFVGLAETVIMVQQPKLNLWNSAITCLVAFVANYFLIRTWGVTGAAFGILLPYVLLGFLRHRALRIVFRWRNPWSNMSPPIIAALCSAAPAVVLRLLVRGIPGELASAAAFLLIYFLFWRKTHTRESQGSSRAKP